jgi:glycosyltransferase involved in cell wall biosynthesis
MRPRRLLTIGHSYVVTLNRRLAHEMSRVGTRGWEVTAAAPQSFHGDLQSLTLERQQSELCAVHPLPVHVSQFVHLMVYGRGLSPLLRRDWDLVHCWEEPYILAAAQIAYRTPSSTPVVFSTFQNIDKRYPPPFASLEQYCLSRSTAWIAGGETIAATLTKRGYGVRPHRVIPLGVDRSVFRPMPEAGGAVRRRLGWDSEGPPVIGYLGRFVKEKGVALLMDALDRTPTRWRALFVGGGKMEPALRRWAVRYGDRVRIVTGVPHDGVPAYLNAMDLLCAPSQTTPSWREQLGRMLIEAFACGVPVIASDSGEIPYVVRDAGIVVAEDDIDAWANAIATLAENPDARAELARRGLERVHAAFTWDVVARAHLAFFDALLENRSEGRN